jgi:two-component sensor histidine kinase
MDHEKRIKKTKAQLVAEIALLQGQVTDLEAAYEQARERLRLCEALEQEIGQRTAQLETLISEKEILLQESHHRIKNNLQIISSLLYLQSEQTQNRQAQAMLTDSQNRVQAMALLHEKLSETEDLTKIDFAEYVTALGAYLSQAYTANQANIHLTIEIDQIFLNIDAAIPCSLIVTELVSNALKHAFPLGLNQEGNILVSLRRLAGNQHQLVISDNGIGLPAGLDLQKPASLGLQLVKRLARQLGGTLQVDRNGGTNFTIMFTL